MKYDDTMDKECLELCDAINAFDGLQTRESCCGHGEYPYRIWFNVDDLEVLTHLLYWVDGCHSGFYGWQVTARTDCAYQYPSFCLEGPVGAYDEAKEIARLLREELVAPGVVYRL